MFAEDISKCGQITVHWGGWWTQNADGKVDREILGIHDLDVEHREGRNYGKANGLSPCLRVNWRNCECSEYKKECLDQLRPVEDDGESQWWGLSLWKLHTTLFPKGKMQVPVRVLRLPVILSNMEPKVVTLCRGRHQAWGTECTTPTVGNHQKGEPYVEVLLESVVNVSSQRWCTVQEVRIRKRRRD